MNETIRRSRREHAADLAASVRRTLDRQNGLPAAQARPAAHGRGRTVSYAAGILMAVGLAVFVLGRGSHEEISRVAEPVGVFEMVEGRPAGASRGTPILAGTRIETAAGAPGTALTLTGGASVRLDADTRMKVNSASVLTLERGAVYIDAASVGTAVDVRTSFGVVRDIGTQFEVRLMEAPDAGDSALRVRVREGAVVLEHSGESHRADLGEELRLAGDGRVAHGTVEIYGSPWDWVVESAPMPDIEGLLLPDFLAWVAREGGLTLRYADSEAEAEAMPVVLHGDVRDSALMGAAEQLLHGSGLEYRLDGGDLVISRSGSSH